MKATFDFIPIFCPNCGEILFKVPEEGSPRTTLVVVTEYQNGQPFTCSNCGLAFQKATGWKIEPQRRKDD